MRRAITHYAPPYLATRNALLSEWVRQYAGELDYGCIRGNALSFYNARVSFVFSPFVPLSLSLSLSLVHVFHSHGNKTLELAMRLFRDEHSGFVSI